MDFQTRIQELELVTRAAFEAAKASYEFGAANSYTYEALLSAAKTKNAMSSIVLEIQQLS